MEMILYKDSNEIYRIRKEEEGCSIFSNVNYIEGDDMLFYILKKFNELGIKSALEEFEKEFPKNIDEIKNDLLILCKDFKENSLFLETVASIEAYYRNEG